MNSLQSPPVKAPVETIFDRQRLDFFATLALKLNLPTAQAHHLAQGEPFVGPSGLLCRLQVEQDETGVLVQPVMVLPLSAAELSGDEVVRMLQLQEWTLAELSWWLGISDEGLLQLTSTRWCETPDEACDALNLVNTMGPNMVRAIVLNEEAPAEEPTL
jgi:hypothetical protein